MKKAVCVLLTLVFTLALCSCGAQKTVPASSAAGQELETVALTDSAPVDLDLSEMSGTMVYSEVYNIMTKPDDYIGKTIRMNGAFATDDNEIYYFCIIKDATACCQQGLEFVWPGQHTYPTDFPDTGADITITGTYKIDEIDGITYTYLEANSVEF